MSYSLLNQKLPDYWSKELQSIAFLFGRPNSKGILKSIPEDFVVNEVMDVIPCGEGEHYWLDISKVKCNTEQLAKALAKFSSVSIRDVGYSGMKDYFAQTRQWFSVWKPKGGEPSWKEFKLDGVTIHQVIRHQRKIKRGTHKSNKFEIVIRNVTGDLSDIENRLERIVTLGVPNYFGQQRFGNNAENMSQVLDYFCGDKKVKSKHLRGILLSSARSWLFNEVVSARIKEGTFFKLHENEPTNLNSSSSIFKSVGDRAEHDRIVALDIHPTAPMWGVGLDKMLENYDRAKVFEWEQEVLNDYQVFQEGLERENLNYQRRAIRCALSELQWSFEHANKQTHLMLSFELLSGQFATSVLREVVLV